MCARFTLRAGPEVVADLFLLDDIPEMSARYNIAPTQPVLGIVSGRRLKWLRWGLVPSWAKDPSMGQKLINARAENLAERPSFRNAFARRRCLIPADGFYEWTEVVESRREEPCQEMGGGEGQDGLFAESDLPPPIKAPMAIKKPKARRQPYYLGLQDFSVFAFAGLWEFWKGADGEPLETCTIITTEPNALVRPMHDRMPVILRPDDHDLWLDRSVESPNVLLPLLRPFPAEEMAAYAVDTIVNSALNETPSCVSPAESDPPAATGKRTKRGERA